MSLERKAPQPSPEELSALPQNFFGGNNALLDNGLYTAFVPTSKPNGFAPQAGHPEDGAALSSCILASGCCRLYRLPLLNKAWNLSPRLDK